MKRVYIGCFGSGLGHASRMLEVAGKLAGLGVSVRFSSSGEVTRLISSRGYACSDLPLADVRYADDGSFSLRATMEHSPQTLARALHQTQLEAANLAAFGPDAVLSDSALPTLLAARLARLPAVTVLNQLNLASSHDPGGPMSRLLSAGMSAAMGRLWELSRELLLPDLPPPYTISERNLWGTKVGGARYIGFVRNTASQAPDAALDEVSTTRKRRIFWQVSGPPATRGPFLALAMSVAKALQSSSVTVVSGGDPSGDASPRKIPGGWYYGWCGSPSAFFGRCEVVVSRAGHGTISQAILASKPSLLVPIPRQPEQEGNALKAQRLGVAAVVPQAELDVGGVERAVSALTGDAVMAGVRRLGEYASRFSAVDEIVATVMRAAG